MRNCFSFFSSCKDCVNVVVCCHYFFFQLKTKRVNFVCELLLFSPLCGSFPFKTVHFQRKTTKNRKLWLQLQEIKIKQTEITCELCYELWMFAMQTITASITMLQCLNRNYHARRPIHTQFIERRICRCMPSVNIKINLEEK